MIRAALPALALLAMLTAPAAAQTRAQGMASGSVAMLRGLDKLSGSTTDIEIAVGGSAVFNRLHIALTGCRYPADNPNADAVAFLEIHDARGNGLLFRGWMIASAPALNALDDARYDVWVLSCR